MERKLHFLIWIPGLVLCSTQALIAQQDTLVENFNALCDQFETPYREYTLEYEAPNGVVWDVQTYHFPSAGGINDDGSIFQGSSHCGSIYWTNGKSGYLRAFIDSGITDLSFQVLSGNFQEDGYVKVKVDGQLVGQTEPVEGYKVETYTFHIDTPGPLMLELSHGIKEGSTFGGILVDNLSWTPREGSRPFFRVESLEDYKPDMDTLHSPLDTMEIKIDTRGCVTLNGEYYDYLGMVETADIVLGAVLDLHPADSTNIYYWGYAAPVGEATGTSLPVKVSVPVNRVSDTILFQSVEGGDLQDGVLSFINGNVEKDLVVFRISQLQHEYTIRYAYDFYEREITGKQEVEVEPAIQFYPNPVHNHAYFKTGKRLKYFQIMDLNGRILRTVSHPRETAEGYYRLNLENLESGIWIVRFVYEDNRTDGVKVIVE